MTNERSNMKIVVIGGSRLIGSKLVTKLGEHGYQAVAASPKTGVNTLSGDGLAEVLEDASVVVDVSNSPSFEEKAVMEFFTTSTRNLLTYEAAAGVGHHIALSVVGTERLSESGYFRAKIAHGPEQFRLDELVRRRLATLEDPCEVIADPHALYAGAQVSLRTLVSDNNAQLGETRFEDWLSRSATQHFAEVPRRPATTIGTGS